MNKLTKSNYVLLWVMFILLICAIVWVIIKPVFSIWDEVRCWDLVTYQYDWKVMYESDWFIVLKGTQEETIFWNYTEKCNEKMTFENCYQTETRTWERTFSIKEDKCFRPNNYQDLINVAKQEYNKQ